MDGIRSADGKYEEAILTSRGLPLSVAQLLLVNELAGWSARDIGEVFSLVKDASEYSLTPLGNSPLGNSPLRNSPSAALPIVPFSRRSSGLASLASLAFSLFGNPTKPPPLPPRRIQTEESGKPPPLPPRPTQTEEFVNPPIEAVEQAAQERKALCVNANEEWRLLSSGYVAISHVWEEGIQSDSQGRGISKAQLQRILEKFQHVRLSDGRAVEWIWLDAIAIPVNGLTVSLREEITKVACINTLDAVYSNADALIVLDALVLQTSPRNMLDVAFVLACGKWMTRVWTYQEIKLSKDTYIITATHVCRYSDMLDALAAAKDIDGPKFKELWMTFLRLHRNDDVGISLADIAFNCQARTTGNDEDYARAFFPILGLKWKAGWNRLQGMEHIYDNRRKQATWLVSMYGVPRMRKHPGWAPDSLAGLSGMVGGDYKWESRGLLGKWYSAKVLGLTQTPSRTGRNFLHIQIFGVGPQASVCQCILAKNEDPVAVQNFADRISSGLAFLLCRQSFTASKNAMKHVLLVHRIETKFSNTVPEAGVHLNVACMVISDPMTDSGSQDWLLRHGSPRFFGGTSGEISYLGDLLTHTEKTMLHDVAGNNDISVLRDILAQHSADIDAVDSEECTALHYAARNGHTEIIDALISARAAIDPKNNYGFTPFYLACEYGHLAAATALICAGANINTRADCNGWYPITAAASGDHVEIIQLLLDLDAPVDIEVGWGWNPLHIAASKGHLDSVRVLVEAGASVDYLNSSADTPLLRAAEKNHHAVVAFLIEHGADVNNVNSYGSTTAALAASRMGLDYETVKSLVDALINRSSHGYAPVVYAGMHGNIQTLELLLKRGAEVNVVTVAGGDGTGGRTALHWAAANGKKIAVRMLLEAGTRTDIRDEKGFIAEDLASTEECRRRFREAKVIR